MAAITCQARQSPALLVPSETGGGRDHSPEGKGYCKGCVCVEVGGGVPATERLV